MSPAFKYHAGKFLRGLLATIAALALSYIVWIAFSLFGDYLLAAGGAVLLLMLFVLAMMQVGDWVDTVTNWFEDEVEWWRYNRERQKRMGR